MAAVKDRQDTANDVAETRPQPSTGRASNRGGGPQLTVPAVGRLAKNLDADINPWERQPGESRQAYAAFTAFRDSDTRKVGEHGGSAYKWSAEWHWGYRSYQWDLYQAQEEATAMVRYRRRMNERQRSTARLAQSKIIAWLNALDPSKLTAGEASRWLEVAVKIERLAGGGETERLAVAAQGPIEELSAEETASALEALVVQINLMTGAK